MLHPEPGMTTGTARRGYTSHELRAFFFFFFFFCVFFFFFLFFLFFFFFFFFFISFLLIPRWQPLDVL